LQRYGEKKLQGPFCNFWEVAKGIFWKYFENQGSSHNFCGLWLEYKETEGPLCKFSGIIDFWIYFSIGNHGGLSPWLMDQRMARWTDHHGWPQSSMELGRAATLGHDGPLEVAQ
jgi:hypothetical protein